MDPIEILKNHNLRVTDCRIAVLQQFMKTDHALSQSDLDENCSGFDRVTLYRTLQNFLEKGILHRIPNDFGYASYGVCFDTCGPDGHHHDHLHFQCTDCGHIQCLEETHLPKVKLPKEYHVDHVDLIIAGTCTHCKHV
ncbi:MAG: Fur family transcriptional regulator [Bacteroidota bacterium]